MALVSIGPGLHIGCAIGGGWPIRAIRSSATMDAAGESLACIGQIQLSTGPGTSATFSSAGAKVVARANTVVFANAGTTLRVGLQDVASTGLEDGTFDAYVDLPGGGGGVTQNNVNTFTLASGSKTLTHGDLVAVVFEMTARGGSDSVQITVGSSTIGAAFPYVTIDSGAGPAKSAALPLVALIDDTGAVAGVFGEHYIPDHPSATSYSSSSTPDEYALLFSLPFAATLSRLTAHLSELDSGENGELILYGDPLGTPTALATATVTADYSAVPSALTDGSLVDVAITPVDVTRGTVYAIAYRPTTTNANALLRRGIGAAAVRAATWLGTAARGGSRSNQSGAFSEDTTTLPMLGAVATRIEDGGPTNAEIAQAVWEYADRQLTA